MQGGGAIVAPVALASPVTLCNSGAVFRVRVRIIINFQPLIAFIANRIHC